MILIFTLFLHCFLLMQHFKIQHFCPVVALGSTRTTTATTLLMSPSLKFLSQQVLRRLLLCQGSRQLSVDAVSLNTFAFNGTIKPKRCLLGFLILEELGRTEVPYSVAVQRFLPEGHLSCSSAGFLAEGRFTWKHRPTCVPTYRYCR